MRSADVKIRVFGKMPAIASAEVHARRAVAAWAVDGDSLDVRLFKAPDELAGHTLSLTEMTTPDGMRVTSAGCAASTGDAVAASIAELGERFVARSWLPSEARRTSARSLRGEGEHVFPVRQYVGRPRYPDRWPCPPYTDARELAWVRGDAVLTRQPVWVPLSLVRLAPATDADSIVEVTTAGLAAGRTVADAEQHALLELIERDALMLAWNAGRGFAEIPSTERAAEAERDWTENLLWTRSDFAVDVFLVLLRNAGRSLYSAGMSAKLDSTAGRAHALAEALQLRIEMITRPLTGVDEITSFATRRRFYREPARLRMLDLLVGSGTVEASSEPTAFEVVLERLRHRGIEPVRVVLLEDAEKAVVRVLAPGLQPMEADARFSRVVERSAATNEWPHPFV